MRNLIYISLLLVLVSCQTAQKTENESSQQSPKAYVEAMANEHKHDAPVANNAWMEPELPVMTETVRYAGTDEKPILGYLARPETVSASTPGLLVIHEWWGLNDNIKMMARRLAAEGYVVLAVDLYEGFVAETPQEAQDNMRGLMMAPDRGNVNMKAAYAYLKEQKNVPKVGVMGWCMGGAWTLNTAMLLPKEIAAANMYYGRVETDPVKLASLTMPVLGIFGAEDRGIPLEGVKRFEAVMDSLGKSIAVHIYEGAGHGFANPSGRAYNVEAASDAWLKTLAFFRKHLY